MISIAIGLLIIAGCDQEAAKWNYAQAMNLAESGDLEGAIELMELANQQAPDDSRIKLSLAQLLGENGQGELGIGHCDEFLETNPCHKSARQIRSMCLQYLGRFDQSLCDYKQCLSGHVARTSVQLNALAYYRALANTDLAKAAKDIQQAIDMEENEYWGSPYLVPMQVRTAVAAGLISRHIDRHEQGLQPLNQKIEQYENDLARQDAAIKALVTEQLRQYALANDSIDQGAGNTSPSQIPDDVLYQMDLHARFAFEKDLENAILNARSVKQMQKSCLGVMLATRALIHEDRQCSKSADRDRRRTQELGFEFDELVSELPSDQACLNSFLNACMYLDTRGFVSGRRRWSNETAKSGSSAAAAQIAPSSYRESLEDLNLAVLSAEFMELALNSPLYNTPELSARDVSKKKKMARRMTAVLLYHRMGVHLRGGNKWAAEQDQRSIEQLGFEPDASLF